MFAGWGLVNLTGLGAVLVDRADGALCADPAARRRDRRRRRPTRPRTPSPGSSRTATTAGSPTCSCRCQFAALFAGLWLMTRNGGLPVVDKLGIATTLGMLNGVAINTAHELGHKKEHLERWFARIALAPCGYGHFFIEHNRGHHVRVATPDDPASSRLGESFWGFLPRTVVGSVRNGWRLERTRLRRMGKRHLHAAQRRPQRLGDDAGAVGGAGRAVRRRHRCPTCCCRPCSRSACWRRSTTSSTTGCGARRCPNGRFERVDAAAQLEQQPPDHEPVPVPPAAAQRPPREPDPALPGAAALRGVAAAAGRLRGDDPARATSRRCGAG